MRINFVTALIVLGAAALSEPVVSSQERQIDGVGVTVFTEPGFRGRSATIRVDTPNLLESGLNDRIVSLRVARGEQWEVCEDSKNAVVASSSRAPSLISAKPGGATRFRRSGACVGATGMNPVSQGAAVWCCMRALSSRVNSGGCTTRCQISPTWDSTIVP